MCKMSAQINPSRVFVFSSDIFFAQSSLGKSLMIYRVRNFYNLGKIRYSLLKFKRKK